MKLHVSSLGDAYAGICQAVLRTGNEVSPRGMRTKEVQDAVIVCARPHDSMPTGCGRNLNPAIGIAEALQLVSGVSVPGLMTAISPTFADFIDDGEFWGAYGPRIFGQVEHVVRKITEDSDTRQAVVTLWDPARDNVVGKRDYPCSTTGYFRVRDDRLELTLSMRSNDVWWGLAYDVFQWTVLQATVANVLGVDCGAYTHHAVSLHAYERDWDKIDDLWLVRHGDVRFQYGIGHSGIPLEDARSRAELLLTGVKPEGASTTEAWMADTISGYSEAVS